MDPGPLDSHGQADRLVHIWGRLPWVILGAPGYGVVAGCLALVTQAEECRLPGAGQAGEGWLGGQALRCP